MNTTNATGVACAPCEFHRRLFVCYSSGSASRPALLFVQPGHRESTVAPTRVRTATFSRMTLTTSNARMAFATTRRAANLASTSFRKSSRVCLVGFHGHSTQELDVSQVVLFGMRYTKYSERCTSCSMQVTQLGSETVISFMRERPIICLPWRFSQGKQQGQEYPPRVKYLACCEWVKMGLKIPVIARKIDARNSNLRLDALEQGCMRLEIV